MMRKNNKRKSIGLLLLCTLFIQGIALGQQLGTYQMVFLPQRSYINPAFHAPVKYVIGLPLMSSFDFQYSNNGFSYSDLVKRRDNDSLYLDLPGMLAGLKSRNRLNIDMQTDLFSLGFSAGRNFFGLHVTEKMEFHFNYSKALMDFLYYGNAATMGTTQNINPQISGSHYREYAFSWSREMSAKITAGLNVKYLYGMENVTTSGMGANLYTNPEDFAITANSDYYIHTSGLDSSSLTDFSFGHYFSGKKNTGFAADLGLIYHPTDHLEISGSVCDIGSITWKENVSNYSTSTNQGAFTYYGIDLNDFINNDTTSAQTYLENLGDSLYSSFDVKTTHESYKWKLPTKMYFNIAYIFRKSHKAGILVKRTSTSQDSYIDYSLNYTKTVKNWLIVMCSFNNINSTPGTLGGGISLNFKNDQVYFISDNIPGVFSWKTANLAGFRVGLNLVFGWNNRASLPAPIPMGPVEP